MDKIIVYLAIKYKGDWDAIYKAINEKEKVSQEDVDRVVGECKYNYITIIDGKYPTNLKGLYKPPFVLFYKGNFDLVYRNNKVGLVSTTRKISGYAQDITKSFANDLVDELIVPVLSSDESVSIIAEDVIKSKGGRYIKVLSSNIEETIMCDYDDCLVITEYPCKPEKHKGLMSQGKLMGALSSRGLFVIEAKNKDKCMIAVTRALENSVDIYAVPHKIGDKDNCNNLIKEGAQLVESIKDIIE